jgi:hypothetical protein
MPTLCRAYATADDAHAAVERLLAAGLPGDDIRVLTGAPERDGRDAPTGRFGGDPDAARPVGAFAGAGASSREDMGAFAGGGQRRGGFGDLDRETITGYRDGVPHVRVASHGRLQRTLVAAGLDERAAAADVEALHHGRVLVLARAEAVAPAVAALDG